MCLEEMLCCSIPEGALFYGETRRRTAAFTQALRGAGAGHAGGEMHQRLLPERTLPAPLARREAGGNYLDQAMEELP